jgi:hypothetical protein
MKFLRSARQRMVDRWDALERASRAFPGIPIIDAYKNGTHEEFQTIRASVAKLTSPPFSKAFFSNFTRESDIDDGEILRFLLSPNSKNAVLSAGARPAHHTAN